MGAIALAMYKSPIKHGIAIITARKMFPLHAKTIIELNTARLAKSANGSVLFPGKINARKIAIGVSNNAVEIIDELPIATAISNPINKSFRLGNLLVKKF